LDEIEEKVEMNPEEMDDVQINAMVNENDSQ